MPPAHVPAKTRARAPSWYLLGAALALAFPILAWQCRRFTAYWQDDAYITFAYAKNLAEHGRLVYRLDEIVEGYTNFLWTILSAGAHALAGPNRILGTMRIVSATAAATILIFVAVANRGRSRPWTALAAPVLLASTSALAFHVNGGLETVLFTLAITAGYVLLGRALRRGYSPAPGLACFLVAALTRFDGFVPLGLAVVAAVIAARNARRRALKAALAVVAIYAAYFLWRASYYDSLLPNTAAAKLSAGYSITARLKAGLEYVKRGVHGLGLYWLAPGLLLWIARSRKDWGELLGAALIGWFFFQALTVGGDAMQGLRFLFPLVPIALIQALAGYDALATMPLRRLTRWPSLALVALFLAWAQWIYPVTSVASRELTELRQVGVTVHGFRKVASAFATVCRPEDEVATDVAGVFAYFTSCRVLDTWGLASREIAVRGTSQHFNGFSTYGVAAPEVVIERHVRFILPYAPVPTARPVSRAEAVSRIFPAGYYTRRPEMSAYELKDLKVGEASYQYLERKSP